MTNPSNPVQVVVAEAKAVPVMKQTGSVVIPILVDEDGDIGERLTTMDATREAAGTTVKGGSNPVLARLLGSRGEHYRRAKFRGLAPGLHYPGTGGLWLYRLP